jgi:hypothetical protein
MEEVKMAKKELSVEEIIESHKPKNFKYVIIPTEEFRKRIDESGYDKTNLDTINNPEMVAAAIKTQFKEYDRDIIKKAKEPTRLEDGIVVSKQHVTKSDKKLLSFGIGKFEWNGSKYVAFRMKYELFDIIEIFILL